MRNTIPISHNFWNGLISVIVYYTVIGWNLKRKSKKKKTKR